MTDGTPLPLSLSGVIVERVVKIDSALLYLIDGAWAYLLDREPLEQTGSLTVENAKNALSDAFYCYLWECDVTPIGTVFMYGSETPPDGWINCLGQPISRTDYADLFAVIGIQFGAGDGSTTFNVPNFKGRSPMMAGVTIPAIGNLAIGGQYGQNIHTLTLDEIPPHDHGAVVSPTNPDANRALVAAGGAFLVQDNVTVSRGGGNSHNNVHQVLGINFIIYAGHNIP